MPCRAARARNLICLTSAKMLLTADFGATIMSITLADLNAEDLKRLRDATMPDGCPMKMTLKPIKSSSSRPRPNSTAALPAAASVVHRGSMRATGQPPVPSTGK